MSALDRMLKPQCDDTKADGIMNSPMAKMLASIIPKEQLEQLGTNIGQTVQYFKDGMDTHTRQNMLIISQNKQILEALGIVQNADGNAGNGDSGNADAGTDNP